MCRFVAYLGPDILISELITDPEHSLIHQSYHSELREPLNGDGFGLGWYAGVSAEPARFRSIQPAWNNDNLRELARVTSSGLVFAHVRAATPGMEVSEANCHPFKRGPLMLMHNGSIEGFPAIRRRFQADLSDEAFATIRGTTDSEHIFARFVDEYDRAASDGAQQLAEALRTTLAAIDALGGTSFLNLAVTDGTYLAVSRHSIGATAPSLFYSTGARYRCLDGVCQMVDATTAAMQAVLVASEPLAQVDGWEPVPENHVLLAEREHGVRLVPVP